MARGSAFDLDADEVVRAALEVFHEVGLDAVSMRTVAARLGVSPVPLYSRVGNKEDLLDAMADRLLADVAPDRRPGEPWPEYTMRWARALRDRLATTTDIRRLLGARRSPYVPAATALIDVLTADGFTRAAAVEACQLVMWATAGFAILEPSGTARPRSARRPAGGPGDWAGFSKDQADHLFALHIGYLVAGIERDAGP